jgi:hypothetical protein
MCLRYRRSSVSSIDRKSLGHNFVRLESIALLLFDQTPHLMNISIVSRENIYKHLNTPFNPPVFSDSFEKENFRQEWHETRDSLKVVLDQFGEWNAYGEGDYFLDTILTLSRGIGVEITNVNMLTRELLVAVQTFLAKLEHAYEADFAFHIEGAFYDMFVSRGGIVTDYPNSFA